MNLKLQKLTFKSYFSSFLIWSAIVLGVIVIFSELILAMITYKNPSDTMANPHNLWTPNSIWAGLWQSLSTFSMQSIILVTVYFFLVLNNKIYPDRSKFVNGRFGLAVTLYATITMLVFWSVLFKPSLDTLNTADAAKMTLFVYTFFLHLAMPLIAITYYLLNAGSQKWDLKRTLIVSMPLTLSYMVVYLAYILIKGTFVGIVKKVNDVNIIDYSYPYNFLNFKNSVGNFLIYFFAILVAFLILYALYFFYNNWRNKQLNKITSTTSI